MPGIPINFPFAGRSDRAASHAQPLLTTREAQNVRARDPKTGRIRGAQRAGLSKLFGPSLFTTAEGRDLCSLSFNSKKISYAREATPVQLWKKESPSSANVYGMDVDSQSNLYVLDGPASMAKYNSAGELLWTVSLPTTDAFHAARDIHVDRFNNVWVCISSGGDQATALIWKYEQLDDNETRLVYTIMPGRYIERMKRLGDLLYTLQNDHLTARSSVVIYNRIDTSAPQIAKTTSVAYPAHDMDVGEDGAFYVASPYDDSEGTARSNTEGYFFRGVHPAYDEYLPASVDWTPRNLNNFDERIWNWFDASKITEADVQDGKLEEGKEVLIWRDQSGHGRDLIKTAPNVPNQFAPTKGPLYTTRSINGLPGLRFDGDAGLWSPAQAGGYSSQVDSYRSLLPLVGLPSATLDAGSFCYFIVCKPDISTDVGYLLATNNFGGFHQIRINHDDNGSASAGDFWLNTPTDAADLGAGTGGNVIHTSYTTPSEGTDTVLITVLCDNGARGTVTKSALRVNGRPIDQWLNVAMRGDATAPHGYGGLIGWVGGLSTNRYIGSISEWVCLRREDMRATAGDYGSVLTHESYDPTPKQAQSVNEMTQIEGYLMHKHGIQHLLDTETADSTEYPHPFGLKDDLTFTDFTAGPPDAETGNVSPLSSTLLNFAQVTKYNPAGRFLWSYNHVTADGKSEAAADRGGAGYCVRVVKLEGESFSRVYTAGQISNQFTGTDGDTSVRMIVDNGDDFQLTTPAWINDDTLYPSYKWLRIDVDEYGRMAYPWTANASFSFKVFEADDAAGKGVVAQTYLDTSHLGVVARFDPAVLDYGVGQTINLRRFLYFAAVDDTYRMQLVDVTATAGSARTIKNLATGGGDIKTFTVAGAIATPTGGSGALESTAEFAMCIPTVGEAVFIDGLNYKVYRAAEDDVVTLEATSAGEIPPNAKIGCFYRNRLFIANFPDNPGGYAASAMGDIRNWDFFPPNVAATSAFIGSLARAKDTPSIVTGLIPATDDLLIIGAYNSIWRMTGDPYAGGELDKVADSIGMAFGKAWTKAPSSVEGGPERIFFFGLNEPGLYMVDEAGGLQNVSLNTLEETDFEDIDFDDHNVRLYWNPIDRGIHIFLTPRTAAAATPEKHWFWEEKRAAIVARPPIWPDIFGSANHQPTCAASLEGDTPADRVFVVLGHDGFLRKWDKDASDDDGTPIDSYADVTLARQTNGVDVMLNELKTFFASDQDGATIELYAADAADRLGPVQQSITVLPGEGFSHRKRVRGENIVMRIRNAHLTERWAFESGWVELLGAQKQRRSG
jgi:hypothetical protein